MPLQLPLQPLLQPQEPEQPLLQLPLHPQEQPVRAVQLEQPQEPERLLQPQNEYLLQELQMLEQELQELLEHVIFNQNLLFSGLLHPILPAEKV